MSLPVEGPGQRRSEIASILSSKLLGNLSQNLGQEDLKGTVMLRKNQVSLTSLRARARNSCEFNLLTKVLEYVFLVL